MTSNIVLSDGIQIPRGNWVMAAQREIMRDPIHYPDPEKFDPFRFVLMENGSLKSKSRFSHPSDDFLFWGSVRRAWYFYTLSTIRCVRADNLSSL